MDALKNGNRYRKREKRICQTSPKKLHSVTHKYWVGQLDRLGVSIRCYAKTQTNFLANPIYADGQGKPGVLQSMGSQRVGHN